MILVLLGTQNNDFSRLLKEVEKNIKNKVIKEDVVVQAGYTKYISKNMKIFDMTSQKEIDSLIKKSHFIISHGGVGTIITALKNNKKLIAVARRKEYHEHVNNHQLEIVKMFNDKGYIIGIDDVGKLEEAIIKIGKFNPNKFESHTNKIIDLIQDFIDNN